MLKREIVPPPEHLFPPDEWRLVEARWTERFADRAETVFALSNGYVGVRGTLEEGRPSLIPGTFVNAFHETWPIVHPEDAYGLARVGQSMVTVPDATVMELFVDDESLFIPTARLVSYQRCLDMREGTLRRDLVWSTPAGKHITVRSSRLVSFEHRHLIAMTFEVTVDRPAPIAVVSRVLNIEDVADPAAAVDDLDPRLGRHLDHRVLLSRVVEGDHGDIRLGYRAANSGMTLGVGVRHVVDTAGGFHDATTVTADRSEYTVMARAAPGVPLRITKYVTYQTSRSARTSTTSGTAPTSSSTTTARPSAPSRRCGGTSSSSRRRRGASRAPACPPRG